MGCDSRAEIKLAGSGFNSSPRKRKAALSEWAISAQNGSSSALKNAASPSAADCCWVLLLSPCVAVGAATAALCRAAVITALPKTMVCRGRGSHVCGQLAAVSASSPRRAGSK